MSTLVDRIDKTREKWVEELKECRESILNYHPIHVPNPLDRLVVELDYLLVEAKLALEAKKMRMASIKLLSSGYYHVRWSKYRWMQWPKWEQPTLADGFGWITQDDVQEAIKLAEERDDE